MTSKYKNTSVLNAKRKKNQVTLYLKGTDSNVFISLFKESYISSNMKSISFRGLLKIFSCGQFKLKSGRKNSLSVINILSNKSILFAVKNNFRYLHVIINGTNLMKRIILHNIFSTKKRKNVLKLLSLTDITHYPYGNYKVKKDKRR